jgi:hypothetical protein
VLRYGPDRDDPAAGGGAPDRVRLPLYDFSSARSLVTGQPLTTYQRGKLRESDLPWYHTPRIALTTARPRGYLVLPGWPQIEGRLGAHGLRVETLRAAIEARLRPCLSEIRRGGPVPGDGRHRREGRR